MHCIHYHYNHFMFIGIISNHHYYVTIITYCNYCFQSSYDYNAHNCHTCCPNILKANIHVTCLVCIRNTFQSYKIKVLHLHVNRFGVNTWIILNIGQLHEQVGPYFIHDTQQCADLIMHTSYLCLA